MAAQAPSSGLTSMQQIVEALELVPHPEGGFFRETYRAGSVPMTTNGTTDLTSPRLVMTDRTDRRPDGDGRRQELTSIYWMATRASPQLDLTMNLSTHVHYYHGGDPFEYIVLDPTTGECTRTVLGPDILAGQRPQVCVDGGCFKCGRLRPTEDLGFVLVGEGVGPGFDFYDFQWVSAEALEGACKSEEHLELLRPFLHQDHAALQDRNACVADTNEFYDDKEKQRVLTAERLA